MKFYVSQLVETENIVPILKKYDVGLEVVQFANPYILDNRHSIVEEYKKELGDVYGEVDLIIHGPYADLSPGARDNLIKEVTSIRFEQAYEVAQILGAKKILYHNGYTPRTYTYIEWKRNVYDFWSDFLRNKNSVPIVVENVLDEDYELLDDLMNKVDEEDFSICLDIGHVNAYSNLNVYEWIDNLSYKINHIHLHNNYGEKDNHFGIDKGSMNVIEVLKVLDEKCDDISVSLEITNLDELEKSLDLLVKEGFVNLK